MKLFGKLRCKLSGCGPHTRHPLDADIDLYVCDCCGDGVMDAPASDDDRDRHRDENGALSLPLGPTESGHVWYDSVRDQARVRL